MNVRIVKPAKEDWISITRLVLKCFPHHLLFPFLRNFYEYTLVAKLNGNVIGFANTMNWLGRMGSPYINYVCVDKKHQGKGIGKKLLEQILGLLKKKYSKVYLKVSFRKKEILGFYEKFGFKHVEHSFLRLGYIMCLNF